MNDKDWHLDAPLFTTLQHQSGEGAGRKGFHDTDVPFAETIALIHSELSEALEEFRQGNAVDEIYYVNGKPEGVPVEMADAIIRIMDWAHYAGVELDGVILRKLAYNRERDHKHGGKRF